MMNLFHVLMLSVLGATVFFPISIFVSALPDANNITDRLALPQTNINQSLWGKYGTFGPPPATYPAITDAPLSWKQQRVVEVAYYYLQQGLAYRHHHIPAFTGADSTNQTGSGLDCSNFSSWCYRLGLGIAFTSAILPQSQLPLPNNTVLSTSTLQLGDLMFFTYLNDPTTISHVGIYCGNSTTIAVIHSHNGAGVMISTSLKLWPLKSFKYSLRVLTDTPTVQAFDTTLGGDNDIMMTDDTPTTNHQSSAASTTTVINSAYPVGLGLIVALIMINIIQF